MTITEMIKDIQNEVYKENITPQIAVVYLNKLSALLGNVNEEMKNRQMAYNRELSKVIDFPGTPVTKAKIMAESSASYESLLEIKGIHELVIEMIRSLKLTTKVSLEEYRETRYN